MPFDPFAGDDTPPSDRKPAREGKSPVRAESVTPVETGSERPSGSEDDWAAAWAMSESAGRTDGDASPARPASDADRSDDAVTDASSRSGGADDESLWAAAMGGCPVESSSEHSKPASKPDPQSVSEPEHVFSEAEDRADDESLWAAAMGGSPVGSDRNEPAKPVEARPASDSTAVPEPDAEDGSDGSDGFAAGLRAAEMGGSDENESTEPVGSRPVADSTAVPESDARNGVDGSDGFAAGLWAAAMGGSPVPAPDGPAESAGTAAPPNSADDGDWFAPDSGYDDDDDWPFDDDDESGNGKAPAARAVPVVGRRDGRLPAIRVSGQPDWSLPNELASDGSTEQPKRKSLFAALKRGRKPTEDEPEESGGDAWDWTTSGRDDGPGEYETGGDGHDAVPTASSDDMPTRNRPSGPASGGDDGTWDWDSFADDDDAGSAREPWEDEGESSSRHPLRLPWRPILAGVGVLLLASGLTVGGVLAYRNHMDAAARESACTEYGKAVDRVESIRADMKAFGMTAKDMGAKPARECPADAEKTKAGTKALEQRAASLKKTLKDGLAAAWGTLRESVEDTRTANPKADAELLERLDALVSGDAPKTVDDYESVLSETGSLTVQAERSQAEAVKKEQEEAAAKAKAEAEAKAKSEAEARAQAQTQAQQSYTPPSTPSYTPPYTPSYTPTYTPPQQQATPSEPATPDGNATFVD